MNTKTDEALKTTDESHAFYNASQWQLMWWKFRKHKLALVSLGILILFWLVAIFAEFVAPYDPYDHTSAFMYVKAQRPRFFVDGKFMFPPVVYELEQTIDPETRLRIYEENPEVQHRLRFFVRGSEYKMWGLIPGNLHLFGTGGPGKLYLLGTDGLGRDMFSRVVYGARISLSIGLVGVFLSMFLGIIFGGLSGFYGGMTDTIIQRVIELIRSFPSIPLWMALTAALPSTWTPVQVYFGITIILSVRGWTPLGRQVRGKILSLRGEDFVMAAKLSGTKEYRIILKHMIPSFTSHIIASLTLAIPGMILAETSLSFLGIGLRPPVISWGVLLQQAQNVHTVLLAPWLMIPGLFVILTVLTFSFLGDGLRDAADPYN